ncbi:TonB-dependent receptor plug domain-containing protein [Bradyrhizobium sp. 31Argb]|uniref:TonB-dependent receptor n=1 Tax=Bradyrhizobium sp. 31Argb TaxID=3141247 RepID=UPI0037484141
MPLTSYRGLLVLSIVTIPRQRHAALAFGCLLPIVLLHSCSAKAQQPDSSHVLPPVSVTQPQKPPAKRLNHQRSTSAARPARSQSSRSAAARSAAPSIATSDTPSPTLSLNKQNASGSRLNLTPLQTPASVETITSQTIAERGQHSITDAVTQNAVGFTASPAPGNGGLSFSTRGFTGSNSVMTLYDGTRLYVGAGTVTFPFDTWSADRIEIMRGPASVLYGEGAIGGIINVIPKKPVTTPYNDAEMSLDTNTTRRIAVDSGGPINPNVSYRVNAVGNMSNGWVDRDETSNLAISAAVRVQAAENLAFTLSNDYGNRSPSRYFGTPLINGAIDDALRFKNYNVLDSAIRYQDNWSQFKTEWDAADGVKVQNTLYYLTSRRHWRDVDLSQSAALLTAPHTKALSRKQNPRQSLAGGLD